MLLTLSVIYDIWTISFNTSWRRKYFFLASSSCYKIKSMRVALNIASSFQHLVLLFLKTNPE